MTHTYKPGDAVIYSIQAGFRDGLLGTVEVQATIESVSRRGEVYIAIGAVKGWISASDPHLRPAEWK